MSSTSVLPIRSRTGCLTCKTRRKKCDETHPKCLRCQRSGLECPGYVYIENANQKIRRLRTAPGLRTTNSLVAQALLAKQNKSGTRQVPPNEGASELPTTPLGDDVGQNISNASAASPSDAPDLSFLAHATPMALFGSLDLTNSWWDPDPTLASTMAQNEISHSTMDFAHQLSLDPQLPLETSDSALVRHSPSVDPNAAPMTSGQASLLQALFSLGDSPMLPSDLMDTSISNSSEFAWLSPDPEKDETESVASDEDPEGISEKLCSTLVLDKSTESNALPFVLQSYAIWITQTAFEPLKMLRVARDFVFQHFRHGEDSQWTVTLLANVVRSLAQKEGSVNRDYAPMLSLLRDRLSHRLAMVASTPDASPQIIQRESSTTLAATLDTILIQFHTSPLSDVRRLLRGAAPLFRRLCPDPPNTPINLPSLLVHPLVSLRHFAHVDIFFNLTMGTPMSFRYDIGSFADHAVCESFIDVQEDIGIQWLHGTPDRFTILFAKMSVMREDGCVIDEATVAEIEREIREFKPVQSLSPDPFLMVGRLVVQECWRQAAYVFLYMGLCGDSSDTVRIKDAFKRFMKLVNKTKPGRVPDDFLVITLLIVSLAARRSADRETIMRRISTHREWVRATTSTIDYLPMIEDYWSRSDAEGRPVFWSDIPISRMRVFGY